MSLYCVILTRIKGKLIKGTRYTNLNDCKRLSDRNITSVGYTNRLVLSSFFCHVPRTICQFPLAQSTSEFKIFSAFCNLTFPQLDLSRSNCPQWLSSLS